MALKYWHALENTNDNHDIASEVFFRTDDAVLSDDAVRQNWLDGTRFATDDGGAIDPTTFEHLEPAVVGDYDTWLAGRII